MVIDLLKDTQALLNGHFLLSSGKHSNGYVQCAKLLQYPDIAQKAVGELIPQLKDLKIDKVVGPAMGGIVIAYEVGRQLGVPAVFTERVNNKMEFRRGFNVAPQENILIVEDVVTTGKSALEAVETVKELGGNVVAIACLVDRGESTFEYPLFSSAKVNVETFQPDDCPLCKENVPLVQLGSRKLK